VTSRATRLDADARLVRRTSLRVGLWIAVAVSVLVVAVLVAAFAFVLKQVPLNDLFDRHHHEELVDVGGLDVLIGGIVIGGLAIILAGTLALLATRRAIAPLVDALARQRRFVADASHELRTPLAILDARIQVLERSLAADDPHRELVEQLRGDSRALTGVVTDLLDSIDVTTAGPQPPVALEPIVRAATSSLGVIADERGVTVSVGAVPPGLLVALPEASVGRALVALVDNAVKHSPPGTTVTVATTRSGRGRVEIAVVDQGPGIQGIEPDRVFDRFARSSSAVDGGGSARSGFGIGLSLVQDTVGRFGGSVEVTRTSPEGTTITMTLPAPRG
jgi:signal transduction histidine kinase